MSTEPVGTLRVIGIASDVATGDVTLVLVETDGEHRIRRLETRVVALNIAPSAGSGVLADAVLQFIGNLVLQPFAVDAIGLSNRCASSVDSGALALGCHVDVATPCDLNDPDDPIEAAATAAYLAARNIRLKASA